VNRRFFDQLLVSAAPGQKPKRAISVPVSIAIHVVVLTAVIVLPLMSMGDLPEPMKSSAVHAFFVEPAAAPPPPPPPPPPAAAAAPKPVTQPKIEKPKIEPPTQVETPKFTAPIETPRELPRDETVDTSGLGVPGGVPGGSEDGVPGGVVGGEPGGVEGGVVGGTPGGVVGGTPGGVEGGVVEAPAPTPEPVVPKGPVRVGGQVRAPKKIRNVDPEYSALAREARASGVVILEAVIGPDGSVDKVRVLRGHPLLNDSAVAAVRQWAYTPTLLNGVPVPVVMTVTVNFRME
jgi:protein TonB